MPKYTYKYKNYEHYKTYDAIPPLRNLLLRPVFIKLYSVRIVKDSPYAIQGI